jgi:hypothetical protein
MCQNIYILLVVIYNYTSDARIGKRQIWGFLSGADENSCQAVSTSAVLPNAVTAITTQPRNAANYLPVDTALTAQKLRVSVLHTLLWKTKNLKANEHDCLLICKLFYLFEDYVTVLPVLHTEQHWM